MVILGADLHKRWHTVVAVSATGRKLGERTVRATPDGHLELRRWAAGFPERRWALEDCRHLSRRLEIDLLRSGEAVVRVPPKLMAGVRRSVREPGKSDPIDAYAVAQAALREPDLPVATLDGAGARAAPPRRPSGGPGRRADPPHPAPPLASARPRDRRAGSALARPRGRPGRPRAPADRTDRADRPPGARHRGPGARPDGRYPRRSSARSRPWSPPSHRACSLCRAAVR